MITLFAAIVAELAAYEYLQLAAVGAESHGAKLRIPLWWMALGTALAFLNAFEQDDFVKIILKAFSALFSTF